MPHPHLQRLRQSRHRWPSSLAPAAIASDYEYRGLAQVLHIVGKAATGFFPSSRSRVGLRGDVHDGVSHSVVAVRITWGSGKPPSTNGSSDVDS